MNNDGTLIRIADALERIADALERGQAQSGGSTTITYADVPTTDTGE